MEKPVCVQEVYLLLLSEYCHTNNNRFCLFLHSIHRFEQAPDGASFLVRPEMHRVMIQLPGPVDNGVFGNPRDLNLPKTKVIITAPFTMPGDGTVFGWVSAKAIFAVVDADTMYDNRIEEHKPSVSQDADIAALLKDMNMMSTNMDDDTEDDDDDASAVPMQQEPRRSSRAASHQHVSISTSVVIISIVEIVTTTTTTATTSYELLGT